MQWTGKVAIVTGAGGAGCGRAVACRCPRGRAAVVLADINEEGLKTPAAS
jgi:NAD(P)-dependent dehydrogenase (short-subunit alcohol dehydrogenase family)